MSRSTYRGPVTSALVLLLAFALVAPALAAPPSSPRFGPAIDGYARYEGQTQCLNVEQPGVVAFRRMLQTQYGANSGGILRGCNTGGTSEHKEGRAYDWMLDANRSADRAKANELLSWLLATDAHGNRHAMARRLGVMYIIWDRQVWYSWRADQGWMPYTGANPHTDHIHFSFSWAGARQQSSFWNPTSSFPTVGGFSDVPTDKYFSAPVVWMVEHQITDGVGNTGQFRPQDQVTRAQLAAFLWRMMDRPTGNPAHGFSDVPNSSYYAEAVRWMKANGITDGVGNTNRFEPNRPVTRAEMGTFMWRMTGRQAVATRHTFPDVTKGTYYDQPVSWLAAYGITDGIGNTGQFAPADVVTRAQAATFLHRLASDQRAWTSAGRIPSTTLF